MKTIINESTLYNVISEAIVNELNKFNGVLPATDKQLNYLKSITGKDYRGQGLTIEKAAELITNLTKHDRHQTNAKPIFKYQIDKINKVNASLGEYAIDGLAEKCIENKLSVEGGDKVIRALMGIYKTLKTNPIGAENRRKQQDEIKMYGNAILNYLNKFGGVESAEETATVSAEPAVSTIGESEIKGYIKNLIRESLFDMLSNGGQFEDKAEDHEEESHDDEPKHDEAHGDDAEYGDEANETEEEKQKRQVVMDFFKDAGDDKHKENCAGYAYDLWPEDCSDDTGKSNARSLFAKKLHGEPNDNGYPYSFSSKEINSLYSMIANRH